jgi:MFS transporter, CP family, cyanate transporter
MLVTWLRSTTALNAGTTEQARLLERALLIVGVAALGFNLRGAITSLPPVFPELADSLGLSAAAVSVLAATPVICFGVVSGFAASFSRRLGEERVLLAALIALMAGLLLRAAAPGAMLFPGTVLAAAAIAVMNVLLSSLIKRRWPQRAGFLIGLYITALSVGAITGSLVSVPLWRATGGSVAVTLGWLAGPAALAALLWLPQVRHAARTRAPSAPAGRPDAGRPDADPPDAVRPDAGRPDPGRPRPVAVYRYPLAWQVTVFMGVQSLLYYAALSWLPEILRDRGVSAAAAGDLLALMGAGNLAVSLVVPIVAQRMRAQYWLVVPTVAAMAAGLAGTVYAPLGSAVIWVLILGAGQNAALSLAIFFTMARAPHPAAAASLSSMAQAIGYLLASLGPLEVGLLHSVTGSWTVPLAVLFGLTGILLVAGLLAARPRVLPAE